MLSRFNLSAMAVLLAWLAPAGAEAASVEIQGGGLIFAPVEGMEIEKYELAISHESVQARYVLRNRRDSEQTLLVTFPLPSLDMLSIADQDVGIADRRNSNFIGAMLSVDGQPVTAQLEQRAVALGLDVTQDVFRAGLPLFPLAADMAGRIEALPLALRLDLLERGVLRADDDRIFPAWTLRSTLFWRQTMPAVAAIVLRVAYKPILGERSFSPEEIETARRSHCIATGLQQSIDRRTVMGKPPKVLLRLSYGFATNWAWSGPIGDLRLTVEMPDSKALLATCRDELRRTGPTTYEWTAKDYYPDDDLNLLILR